jgi:hypothetical protein
MNVFDDCNSILDVLDEVTYGLERYVAGMERVSACSLGLDVRCGTVYIDKAERVIVANGSRGIDYYGGFEYIKEGEGRTTIGDFVIYSGADRVEDCFDSLEDVAEEEEAE